MRFSAHVVTGSGRGKSLSVPTVNVDLRDVPDALEEGIYACQAGIKGTVYPAAMHYGPRPVFNDSKSLELHFIDTALDEAPQTLTVEVVERIREVRDFPSPEELTEQMHEDIARIRDILGISHDQNA